MSALSLHAPTLPANAGLEAFRDLHRGERCFVVGCAPSLQHLDLARLRGEWAFTVNRGYLAASLGLPQTPYYVVGDPHTYRAYWQEIRAASLGRRFYRANVIDLPEYQAAADREPAICYPYHEAPTMDEGHFATDIMAGAYRGFTVVLDAVQLAYFMGFAEVHIIGCDLDYQASQTHIYGTGAYEQRRINDMPISRVLQAMTVAAEVFRRDGRVLSNAGVGGRLNNIPRVSFTSLFQSGVSGKNTISTPTVKSEEDSDSTRSVGSGAAGCKFVSFLLPYIDRGQGPLYHWVMVMQAALFSSEEIAFISDESYFHRPPAWGREERLYGFNFTGPTKDKWEKITKHSLPRSIFENLERSSKSMLDAFRFLLTEDYPPLREALESIFAEMCRTRKPDAVLSWCHVPSLKLAAAKFGIPVIHNELGPLRGANYLSTVYFDFNGVNGFTSAGGQSRQFAAEAPGWDGFQPLSLEELRELLITPPGKRVASTTPPSFKAGAALQVEDDSNLIAFAQGMTNFELIHAARRGFKQDQVLIRHHPHGYARYSDKLGVWDQSEDAIDFLHRCEHVFTTNSSVAFECLLQDKPVTILGDSPAAGLTRSIFQDMTPGERLLHLNWLFLGYLVPAARLFDADYYRWRLSQPTLRQIYERHLADFCEAKRNESCQDACCADKNMKTIDLNWKDCATPGANGFFRSMEWRKDRMLLDGRTFRLQQSEIPWDGDQNHFVFYKLKGLVDQYEAFFADQPRFAPKNVFELGLWDGGSMVFWFNCFKPAKHVGVDLQSKQNHPYFQEYLSQPGVGDRLKPIWSVDQQDSARLRQIWAAEFNRAPLDLVIDDASHLYGPTKASFETLFPLLRPGGFYIIEDWAWDHWTSFHSPDHPWAAERRLTDFMVELMEAAGTGTHVIRRMYVCQGFVVLERGPAVFNNHASFKLEDHIARREKAVLARSAPLRQSVAQEAPAAQISENHSSSPGQTSVSIVGEGESVIASNLAKASVAVRDGHLVLARLLIDEVLELEPDNANAQAILRDVELCDK